MEEERLTKFIGAYVTEAMSMALEIEAKRFGLGKSFVIRKALSDWFMFRIDRNWNKIDLKELLEVETEEV